MFLQIFFGNFLDQLPPLTHKVLILFHKIHYCTYLILLMLYWSWSMLKNIGLTLNQSFGKTILLFSKRKMYLNLLLSCTSTWDNYSAASVQRATAILKAEGELCYEILKIYSRTRLENQAFAQTNDGNQIKAEGYVTKSNLYRLIMTLFQPMFSFMY